MKRNKITETKRISMTKCNTKKVRRKTNNFAGSKEVSLEFKPDH